MTRVYRWYDRQGETKRFTLFLLGMVIVLIPSMFLGLTGELITFGGISFMLFTRLWYLK
jgi:hypothetical protein